MGVEVAIHSAASGATELWAADLGDSFVTSGVLAVDIEGAGLATLLAQNTTLWLEFTIDGEVLSPRQRISSVPYAHVAGNAQMLGGMPPSAFMPASDVVEPSQLPTNGVTQISNGALSNAFDAVAWNWTGTANIIDFPAPAASAQITTSETGNSYLTGVTVFTQIQLNTISRITMTLEPPAGSGVGAIILINDQVLPFGTRSDAWTLGNAPALGDLLGKKVQGIWTLMVKDNDLNSPAGTVVGTITTFNVSYDVVRSDHMAVAGRLDVSGPLNAEGLLSAKGGIARKLNRVMFNSAGALAGNNPIPGRTLSFTKQRNDTLLEVRWQEALRCGSGSGEACRVELRVNGQSCSSPSAMLYDMYMSPTTTNHHRPQTLTGYCSHVAGQPIPAGPTTVTAFFVGPPPGNSVGEFYYGWQTSQGSLVVEEVY